MCELYNMGTILKICFLVLQIMLHCDKSVTKLTCKVVPLKARPSLKAKMIFSGTVLPTLAKWSNSFQGQDISSFRKFLLLSGVIKIKPVYQNIMKFKGFN